MKKHFQFLLMLVLSLSIMVSCKPKNEPEQSEPNSEQSESNSEQTTPGDNNDQPGDQPGSTEITAPADYTLAKSFIGLTREEAKAKIEALGYTMDTNSESKASFIIKSESEDNVKEEIIIWYKSSFSEKDIVYTSRVYHYFVSKEQIKEYPMQYYRYFGNTTVLEGIQTTVNIDSTAYLKTDFEAEGFPFLEWVTEDKNHLYWSPSLRLYLENSYVATSYEARQTNPEEEAERIYKASTFTGKPLEECCAFMESNGWKQASKKGLTTTYVLENDSVMITSTDGSTVSSITAVAISNSTSVWFYDKAYSYRGITIKLFSLLAENGVYSPAAGGYMGFKDAELDDPYDEKDENTKTFTTYKDVLTALEEWNVNDYNFAAWWQGYAAILSAECWGLDKVRIKLTVK